MKENEIFTGKILIALIIGVLLGVATREWLIVPESISYLPQFRINSESSLIQTYSNAFDFIKWFSIVLVTGIGGLLTFFGIKTYDKIDKKVNDVVDNKVKDEVKKLLKNPNLIDHIEENMEVDKKIKDEGKVLEVYNGEGNRLTPEDKKYLGKFKEVIKKSVEFGEFKNNLSNYLGEEYDLIIYSIKNHKNPESHDKNNMETKEKDLYNIIEKLYKNNQGFIIYCQNRFNTHFSSKINMYGGSSVNSPVRLATDTYNRLKIEL